MNMSIVTGLLRHILTFAGGYMVAKGWLDDATANTLIGALVTLVGGSWSVWEKAKA